MTVYIVLADNYVTTVPLACFDSFEKAIKYIDSITNDTYCEMWVYEAELVNECKSVYIRIDEEEESMEPFDWFEDGVSVLPSVYVEFNETHLNYKNKFDVL